MKKIILAIIILSITICCNNKQAISKKESMSQYNFSILFGSGGGFTGQYDNYELTDNGKLFKLGENTREQLKTITSEEKNTIFKQVKVLSIKTQELNSPGNITQYLGIKELGKEYKLTWGNPEFTPPKEVQDVYLKLNELLK